MPKDYVRLPRDVCEDWREKLETWDHPAAFRARIDEIFQSISSATLFNQGGLQFLRDAWIASRVACGMNAKMVRLCPFTRPDFEIDGPGGVRLFEATEAMRPGRRRGIEFLERQPGLRDDTEAAHIRFKALPAAVNRVVSKKMLKRYDAEVALVIYVPEGSYGWFQREGVPLLKNATEPGKETFSEILVLWEGTLFSFWKNGTENSERWLTSDISDA